MEEKRGGVQKGGEIKGRRWEERDEEPRESGGGRGEGDGQKTNRRKEALGEKGEKGKKGEEGWR